MVNTGGGLSGHCAGHNTLCGSCRRLYHLGACLCAARAFRRVRQGDPPDPARHRRRPAGGHTAAVRGSGLRRRRPRPRSGGPADPGLRRAEAVHGALCGRGHPRAGAGLPADAGAGRPVGAGAEAGGAGLHHARLLVQGAAQPGHPHVPDHPDRPVYAGHAGAAQRRLCGQRQSPGHGDGAGVAADGAVRVARLQRGRHHRRHLHRQGGARRPGQALDRRHRRGGVLHPDRGVRRDPGGGLHGPAFRLHHHPGGAGPAGRHRRQPGGRPGRTEVPRGGFDHLPGGGGQHPAVRDRRGLLGPGDRADRLCGLERRVGDLRQEPAVGQARAGAPGGVSAKDRGRDARPGLFQNQIRNTPPRPGTGRPGGGR
uniref:Integral membrane protein n=1 Tax=Parastrongyloides trichosuri TaxID=131310 RepID=A0A0N4ZJU2_PARTI